ncbi:hypothetical protein [Streptomyces sp. NRRL S-475]|uniref:hypothetical protein n=1 Tax=Streptomyces sp. NRRL S-475 TaxID=1463910 RepID=UPI0004C7BCAD|nr:hypothetical protein [Streptomyces sp. NRRL S-475]
MALRIFETDPDAKPKVRENDTVGRFRTGRQVGNRPESLSTFRITTGDPEVADKVAELFGGTPAEWETSGEDFNEVVTDVDYGLGKFRFQSTSWKLAEVVDQYENALAAVKGEALAELSLELVEYTTKSGRDVSYRKPALKVIKPWSEAIADAPDTDY